MDFGRAVSVQVKKLQHFSISDVPCTVMNSSSASSFVQIHEHLYLALYEETQATKMAQHTLKTKYLVVPCVNLVEIDVYENFVPSPLQEIYKFDELANQASRRNADLRLVFCAGLNPVVQARVIFLLGCHMVISLGMDPDMVYTIFQKAEYIRNKECNGLLEGWWSLQCAKNLGWINFQDPFQLDEGGDEMIRMDEYLHYCSPINGSIHPLIPGRVLLFESTDDDLGHGRMWADKDGRRCFSSAFHADLLAHLGAAAVVSFDDPDDDPDNARGAAFAAAGISYCA
eukprot:CAMPEP_0172165784 /NCGR_PEP_ID=MMETSP1050-20130122/8609_1 /TAXON_ID=233186 /ORGANISM="Cryptomonas curvata, Strain CCAP979/52" /LENGTH=284 /DNA_ID=CAMNT_0012836303 /DNA_START=22 /DNA_END=873 /DNA_ORIENTATION=+